jgi:hypothetical protein
MAPKPKDIWGVPIPSPKDVVNYLNNAVNQGRIASGDKAAILPGDQGVRNLGRGISMTNDYLNPYANTTKQLLGMAAGNPGAEAKFAKSLARDVAITGAAVGLGAVAGKAVKATQQSGIPARLKNAITGDAILVHGSPAPNLKAIDPRAGSARFPDKEVAFGWNPKEFLPNNPAQMTTNAMKHTGTLTSSQAAGFGKIRGTMPAASPEGSLYVVKGKTSQNIVTNKDENFMMAIKDKMPVLQEFKLKNYVVSEPSAIPGKPSNNYFDEQKLRQDVIASIKASGGKTQKNPVQKMLDKVEAAKMAKRQKIANQNSVV